MRVRRRVRKPEGQTNAKESIKPVDFTIIEPDAVLDVIRKTLFSLTDDEMTSLRSRLLSDLRKARLHVGACLFMLGIPASAPEDLTPTDIAQLVRYVRINQPHLMQVVEQPIAEQLGWRTGGLETGPRPVRASLN